MHLQKIISLANKKSEIRFLAMIRSLRDTGCNLPVWVIPYDDDKFELPNNCKWWEIEDITSWLGDNNAHRMMRKYQCLVTSNYQFVDSDVIFLRNPENVLFDATGFITSCGHWHNPGETCTRETIEYYKLSSTTWQKSVFNAGQFACDVSLYNLDDLKATAENPKYRSACIDFKFHDQPGLNLLVHLSKVNVTNLTLPPTNMESTWAGDYPINYENYWIEEKTIPYLIHWAGCRMDTKRPVDGLFFKYLNSNELECWEIQELHKILKKHNIFDKIYKKLKLVILKYFNKRFLKL